MQVSHNDAMPGSLVSAALVDPNTNGAASTLTTQSTTAGPAGVWVLDLLPNSVADTDYGVTSSYWQITEPSAAGAPTVWNVIVPATTAAVGTPLGVNTLTAATPPVAPAITVGETVYNVANYGMPTDGVTDGSAELATVLGYGGVTFFPPGVWCAQAASLPAGPVLRGVQGGGSGITLSQSLLSTLRLTGGANTGLLVIPQGNAHGIIQYLEIDGNSANQTSAGGVALVDFQAGPASGEECRWDLNHVWMHDSYGDMLLIDSGRRMVTAYKLEIGRAGARGLVLKGTDCRFVFTTVESSGGTCNIDIFSEGHWVSCDSYNATNVGVILEASTVGVEWFGGKINLNGTQGLFVNAGVVANFYGTQIGSNSQTTDATSPNVQMSGSTSTFVNLWGCGGCPMPSGVTKRVTYDVLAGSGCKVGGLETWTPSGAVGASPDPIATAVISRSVVSFAAASTWDPHDYAVALNATSAPFSQALPTASSARPGVIYVAYKSDSSANAATVTGAVGGNVALSSQYSAARFTSTGSSWVQV